VFTNAEAQSEKWTPPKH